jgi:hypothetical protein
MGDIVISMIGTCIAAVIILQFIQLVQSPLKKQLNSI